MAVIMHPLATEKAVAGIEENNEIVFIVAFASSKKQIRAEAEELFKAKVKSVKTGSYAGRKKAVVKFVKSGDAADVAARLKII